VSPATDSADASSLAAVVAGPGAALAGFGGLVWSPTELEKRSRITLGDQLHENGVFVDDIMN